MINYISSVETLFTIASFYEQLSAISSSHLIGSVKDRQRWPGYKIGKQLFTDRTREELENVIGAENVDKVPELTELFQKNRIVE